MFSRQLASRMARAAFNTTFPTTMSARTFTQMPSRLFPMKQHTISFKSSSSLSLPTTTPITSPMANFHVKLKTNKHKKHALRPHHASVKRYWLTGSDRIFRFKNGMNHKRRRKSTAQLRRLNRSAEIPRIHYRRVSKMLGIAPKKFLPPTQSRPTSRFWTPPKKACTLTAQAE